MTAAETDLHLLIRRPAEISDSWLSSVLDRPGLTVESTRRIGTGQMSQNHRVAFRDRSGGDGTVVVKLASEDETSRTTGVGMGAYFREIAFYRNLADRLGRSVPHAYLAVFDPGEGWFTLVLADVVGAEQGDQIAGCSVQEARLALIELARIHAPVFNDLAVGTKDYLNQPNPLTQALLTAVLPGFLDRYDDRMAAEHVEVCKAFVPVSDAWFADRRPPLGLVHADFRLDNLLFTEDACTVVDWQTLSWGPVMMDAAYLLGGGLDSDARRREEQGLVRAYHDELIGLGVQNFSFEQCWSEYRRQTFWSLVMIIGASMVTERTDRGDDMFMAWVSRACQQILDLDALELLPEVGVGPSPLTPEIGDEAEHRPGPEPLWNESWYFDAISDDGGLGLYVRVGRLPNRDCCIYTAAVVRPGSPALLIVDHAAPLPGDAAQTIATAAIRADQECLDPLKEFRVRLRATAQQYADHSAPLRAESGDPVDVSLELTWHTDGQPFAWRQSTRYEIPCRVSGRVVIDGEEIEFAGPGQRDHSWGSRDWWAGDWMWSAFHLDDGTRTHTVTVPGLPGVAIGYVQRDGVVTELQQGHSTAEVLDDGLVAAASLAVGESLLELDIAPTAFGALRMVAPDGRVAHFPRAMATVATKDGRSGVGWIEWNRNLA